MSTLSSSFSSDTFQALKECADEIDLGTQYHLTRYAFLFESVVLGDGSTLAPGEDAGACRGYVEAIGHEALIYR